jgi:hypothetical protein
VLSAISSNCVSSVLRAPYAGSHSDGVAVVSNCSGRFVEVCTSGRAGWLESAVGGGVSLDVAGCAAEDVASAGGESSVFARPCESETSLPLKERFRTC